MTASPTDTTSKDQGNRRSRRALWLGLGAVALVGIVVVLVVFQPQKLFIDDEVDEAVPVVAAAEPAGSSVDSGAGPAPTEPPGPTTRAQGPFISRDHGTTGVAQILDVGELSYLRIEDLDTDNGPDLYVYLTASGAEGPESAFDDDFVDLGPLKGNIGNQNYELPPDVDLSHYRTVVIWCDRFDSAFGAADLA